MKARAEAQRIGHPERVVPVAFLIGMAIGTLLLMLPVSRAGGMAGEGGASFVVALFTATSAICVTGLTVVDTPGFWSPFGHVVILLLAQAGGLGIMTGATLLGLLVTRRMKLSGQLLASAEMRSLDLGDVRHVLRLVVITTFATEAVLALWLALRFWALGHGIADALWQGLFHAVMAFVNAGFSTLPEGLASHPTDFLLLTPLMIGVILGGIGFPVLYELHREWRRPDGWSIHTKLTLWGSVALILVGFFAVLLFEFNNAATIAAHGWGERLLGALFHSVMTRTAGFNSVDITQLHEATWFGMDALMFIGGGPAGTAGGIKITTFGVLLFIIIAELRGDGVVNVFGKRLSRAVHRQAITVALLAVALVARKPEPGPADALADLELVGHGACLLGGGSAD